MICLRKKKFIIALTLLLIIFGCLYLRYENTTLQVSNYNIVNKKIPNDFNGYKIIQISDFHNTKSKTLTNDLIAEIKVQKPNIIVITGDLIDMNRTDIQTAIAFIKEMNTVAPIYYVSGNHEANITNYLDLEKELLENDVVILDNKVAKLTIGASEINLLGIADPQMAYVDYSLNSEIVNTELKSIKYDNNKYSILLSHRPELFNNYVENGIDLVLAGHAHGGQIRIPFIGGLVAPNQGLFPKYTSGLFERDKTTMIVSRGIGNSILPYRINNRPNLVSITLRNS